MRPARRAAAPVNKHHVVEYGLHVRDEVRGDEHRGPRLAAFHHRIQHQVPRGRVHAAEGLIQQIELCPAAHHQRELHLLPQALGELAQAALAVYAQAREQRRGPLAVKIRVEVREKVHELTHPRPLGQLQPLRHVRDGRLGLRPRRAAAYKYTARARLKEPVRQLDKRGLAAAVGAQQAHNVPRLHSEVDIFKRLHRAVALAQADAFEYCHPFPSFGDMIPYLIQ